MFEAISGSWLNIAPENTGSKGNRDISDLEF